MRNNNKRGNAKAKFNNNKKKGNDYNRSKDDKSVSRSNVNRGSVLDSSGRDNDPNWYFTSTELANQAAQLSFQNVIGFGNVAGYVMPSICRVDMISCPGVTVAGTPTIANDLYLVSSTTGTFPRPVTGKAGVNMMADKLYTTLSSFTGRTASYAPQDVAMMILAIASVAEFSETLRRCFGLALTYNPRNRTIPLGLLRSMDLDVDDFKKNISIYRMRFNVAMSRINQIPLLENVAYIKKSRDIYQRIYTDSQTNMSQIFYYMPQTFSYLEEQLDSAGTRLVHVNLMSSNVPNTMDTLLTYLELQIDRLLESSTLNFIYADLLNMANKLSVPTWQFDYLAENYVIMPEFNSNALLQFHNLTIAGEPAGIHNVIPTQASDLEPATSVTDGTYTYNITQGADVLSDANVNEVVYNPVFPGTPSTLYNMTNIVDMDSDQPTVEDRIEALRLAAAFSGMSIAASLIPWSSNAGTSVAALPDHYVTRLKLFTNVTGASAPPTTYTITTNFEQNSYSAIKTRLFCFDHAPITGLGSSSGITNIYSGDMNFFTTVNYAYIQRLLTIMYVGLFDFRV